MYRTFPFARGWPGRQMGGNSGATRHPALGSGDLPVAWSGSQVLYPASVAALCESRPRGNFSSNYRLPSTPLVPVLAFGFFVSESCT